MTRRAPLPLAAIFGAPLTIAVVSGVGLISALLEDGVYDQLSWFALAVPFAAIAWSLRYRRESGSRLFNTSNIKR